MFQVKKGMHRIYTGMDTKYFVSRCHLAQFRYIYIEIDEKKTCSVAYAICDNV